MLLYFQQLEDFSRNLDFLARALLCISSLAIVMKFQEMSKTELVMSNTLDNRKTKMPINIMDALLYIMAGSAMAIISVSFLLWLRF